MKHTGDSVPPRVDSLDPGQSKSGSANPGARTGRPRKPCHTTGLPKSHAADSPLWCSIVIASFEATRTLAAGSRLAFVNSRPQITEYTGGHAPNLPVVA